MTQIHSDVVSSTSAGGTGDTFDTVGTIRTRSDAQQLLGFYCSAGPVTGTAAEAFMGQYEFTDNDIGLSTVHSGPPWEGGAPATNIGHRPHAPYWIPAKRGSSGNPIGQTDILVRFTTDLPDVAVASAVAVAGVYTATGQGGGSPPESILNAYRSGAPNVLVGDIANSDHDSAVATTVAETAIADLTVESAADAILGFTTSWVPDAFAAEESIGFIRYRSSIPDFEPQEWLLPGTGAALGTAVGVGMYLPYPADYATYFPKKVGALATVTPNVVWVVATTTSSPTVGADVSWRRPDLR